MPIPTKTLAVGWQSYFKMVIPAGAPSVQIQETRRAFYAGAWAALTLMTGVGTDDVSLDDGAAYVGSLLQECRDFQERVGEDL